MGEPKQLLDWGGQPLIAYQVNALKEAGVDEVIVVLGYRSDDIHRRMKGLPCRVMNNARYQMGRAGSLRIGAKAVNRDAEAIVILNVDQPRPATLIRALLDAHDSKYAATRPSHDGHSGHPVVVSGWLRDELLLATEEGDGLRGILRARPAGIQAMPAGRECLLDVNTPDEYHEALNALGIGA